MRVPTFERSQPSQKVTAGHSSCLTHIAHAADYLDYQSQALSPERPVLPSLLPSMLAIVLESRPHDLYALGGSTEPVVAPQCGYDVGQAKKFKIPLVPLSPGGAPNSVPAPVPYSRERFVFRSGYYCHLQMVLWTCGPPRRANHWTCRE